MTDSGLRTLQRGRILVGSLALGVVLLMVAWALVGLYVDALWFDEVGYSRVFWTKTMWLWGTRAVVGGVVALVLFFNLRYAARTLTGIQIKRRFANLEISEQLPRTYVLWAITGISALLALWFAASVGPDFGALVLFAAHAGEWGTVEPILGRDLAFYIFRLPLLTNGTTFLLIVAFLAFTVCAAGYAATGSVRWGKAGVVMGNQPRIHLGALATIFVLFLALRFWLARYGLLLDGNSAVQGIFGYADARARLPALRVLTVLTAGAAVLVFYAAWRNRLVPALVGIGLVVVGGVAGARLYPSLIQRFRVEPNELERETLYIQHNLAFTRLGFGLDLLEEERFRYDSAAELTAAGAREQVRGLPVWTEGTLLTTFRELEARYTYYDFGSVVVDRYDAGGTPEVVTVSVREVEPSGIPDPNWQNLHIRETYIRGMGAVAASGVGRTAEGRPPMYLSAIPPEFSAGVGAPPELRLTRPSVFVGARPQPYAVISPSDSTFLVPAAALDGPSGRMETGDSVRARPGVDFPEGIPLDAFSRKLALAWRHRDANLLFAEEVTDSSRFVMRRQVQERARAIAPFLVYPEEPYPVIHDGRIVWILEGFTATGGFPLSRRQPVAGRFLVSYLRNSVKVAVDALSGEVRFYALPERDPLLDVYGRAFPGLLTPFESMPPELRSHMRYSRQLMNLQATVLVQYHQDSAPIFHGQRDVWAIPQELSRGASAVAYQPEYGLYRLPGEESREFHLTTVFVPQGRQNLTAFLAGRLEPDGTRRLRLLDVPAEDQAPGPPQVEALIEQDPVISQQFSLWRTGGSQVWTGHLHLVPVGARILYMEAIFLAAEANAIPELGRFVVSDGSRVVMEPTLDAAVAALTGEELERVAETEDPTPEVDLVSDPARWPTDALNLLDEAEARLRQGDWEGFGRALEALRQLLEGAAGGRGG